MAQDILVIDDEADIRELVSGILDDEGYESRVAADSDSALVEVERRRPSLVILDIWLQGSRLDGLELLDVLKQEYPDLPVIIISGHGNIETAVSAMKRGAYTFIEKPFKADHLLHTIGTATETARLRRENEELRYKLPHPNELVGTSAAAQNVRQTIDKVSATNSRVMITGPAGAGKEVVARLIHANSKRATGPFVVINAASMAPDRMEIELFGEERRRQGDPAGRKIGLFEQAHGGTLFFDEIADMPLETQGKILRVLVDQTFERVGGHQKVQVDVRVMSASNQDLRQAIEEGRFREDLYHRLNVVPINVPPLSERRDDIPELASYVMKRVAAAIGLRPRGFSDDAMAALQAYAWPGNLRQLRNVIERMLIMAGDDPEPTIGSHLLPEEFSLQPMESLRANNGETIMAVSLRDAREAFEREYLRKQIERFGGNISKTAAFVGMERSALHRKLKLLGLHDGRKRADEA